MAIIQVPDGQDGRTNREPGSMGADSCVKHV